ncbi:Hypothetical protein POVR1_LOCUS207 [uncultured virus]|nr:Hypothetical protein POVR1_LOCUS207 [uncultured virus]
MEEIFDCVTYEPIRPGRMISIQEGDHTYCFDIQTLYKHFLRTHQLINPYTMQALSPHINRAVRFYGELQKTIVTWKDLAVQGTFTTMVDSFLTVGDLLLEILRNTTLPVHVKTFYHLEGISSFFDAVVKIGELDFYSNLETPLSSIVSNDNNLECALHPHHPTLLELNHLEKFLMNRLTESYTPRLYELLITRREFEESVQEEKRRSRVVEDVWLTICYTTSGISENLIPETVSHLEISGPVMMSQIIYYDDPSNLEAFVKNCSCLDAETLGPVLKLLNDLNYPHVNKYLEIILKAYSLNGTEILDPLIFKMVAHFLAVSKKAKRNQIRILRLLLIDRSKLEVFALETIPNPEVRAFIANFSRL